MQFLIVPLSLPRWDGTIWPGLELLGRNALCARESWHRILPIAEAPSLVYGDEISEVVSIGDIATFGTGWSSQAPRVDSLFH